MSIEIAVNGWRELDAAIAKVNSRKLRPISRSAVAVAAKHIGRAVKAAAPRKSGLTRRSVYYRLWKRKGDMVAYGVQIGKQGWYKDFSFYAAFVEFGWRWGKRPGKGRVDNRKQIAGRFWARRAAESAKAEALRVGVADMRIGLVLLLQ